MYLKFAFFDHTGDESDKGLRVYSRYVLLEYLDEGLEDDFAVL